MVNLIHKISNKKITHNLAEKKDASDGDQDINFADSINNPINNNENIETDSASFIHKINKAIVSPYN